MATMEGWLQVPAERNLIGRAGTWKNRYVKFGTYSPTTPTTSARPATTISPARPTTATGVVQGGGMGNSGKLPQSAVPPLPAPLPLAPSTAAASGSERAAAESALSGMESVGLPIYLTIYKQKTDMEPIARYPLTSIASCYIGDVASRHNKKKSVILPTLIVNLRAEVQLSSSKSFRRRSHDVPVRDGAKKESTGREILYFRPAPENIVAIEKWAKEIQSYLLPSYSDSSSTAIEPAFRDGGGGDGDTSASSPSLFFINGEPSTALLSPSLRSRASNLSSIESDDKGSVMSSSASELPSPRLNDDDSPRSDGTRPPLHVSTKLRHSIGAGGPVADEVFINTPTALPPRRETILDRFFSSTAPSSPNLTSEPVPMNSIARFEAYLRDIESGRGPDHPTPLHTSVLIRDHPKRIPSPTQRALEYVSTGLLRHSSEGAADSASVRSGLGYQDEYAPPDREHLSVGSIHRTLSRQASEASLGTTASMAGSIGGGPAVEANLSVSNGKRHSVADFSMMRLSTTPPMFQLAASRRGSHSDIPRSSESYDDGPSPLPGKEFGSHPRVTRPLFREFSF